MITIASYLPLLLHGTVVTLGAWAFSGILSIVLGGILGIASSAPIGSPRVRYLIKIYTFIAKGIPAYVQILIAYFVIPSLTGLHISGFFSASMALAFCSSGYMTEIIRAGINSVASGQWSACFVLGYSLPESLYRIIMPQALKTILAPGMGELEQLLKSTCLLATIGVSELTRAGMNIISRELNPITIYLVIAVIYLLFSAALTLTTSYIEKKVYVSR